MIIKNGSYLTISKASIGDANEIVNFLNKVGGESDFLTFGLNEFPYSVKEEEEIIKECLEFDYNLMLVGKIDGHIVSQLFLCRSNKPRIAHIGNIGISVSKDFWGQSIARYMLLATIEWAKNTNITKLELKVLVDNARAINLYQKIGFTIEGTILNAMMINHKYYNEYIMGLLL